MIKLIKTKYLEIIMTLMKTISLKAATIRWTAKED